MQTMTIEELKTRIMSGQQQYWNRDQVIQLLDKLEPQKQQSNVLTLF
jgi:predicted RNA-binding protein with EMAP domain